MSESLQFPSEAGARPHQKLAADCWHLILVLMTRDDNVSVYDDEMSAAARHLIEMACDSAAESERFRQRGPR